jgi:hypothetical protein
VEKRVWPHLSSIDPLEILLPKSICQTDFPELSTGDAKWQPAKKPINESFPFEAQAGRCENFALYA